VQWHGIEFHGQLRHRQSFRLWHKTFGKVQEKGRGPHKDEKGIWLSMLHQNGEGKGYQPIRDPIHKDTECCIGKSKT
jgi:hypothetical protein